MRNTPVVVWVGDTAYRPTMRYIVMRGGRMEEADTMDGPWREVYAEPDGWAYDADADGELAA